MDRIEVWVTREGTDGNQGARPLVEVHNTETERRLEDLLVKTPDLLLPGLRLIGRQVPTAGGPLDLLGVDADGGIVLFELKRGTLTRDAVAQVLDYASDLLSRDPDDFAHLIESSSGRSGIDRIEDFSEWFAAEFPDLDEPNLESIRMVLVGLGADERALRVVNFLAGSGLDISLLTYQAFQQGRDTLIARRVETVEPKARSRATGGTKEDNRRYLRELAAEQGVADLLEEVSKFVAGAMPEAYMWPHKTAYGYSLNDLTDAGRPSLRSYGGLWVDQKEKGLLRFSLPERAIEAAPEAVDSIISRLPSAQKTTSSWTPFELRISNGNWAEVRAPLVELIRAVKEGRERRIAMAEAAAGAANDP